jgi:DNA-binding transcriptional ArsR family regulator
MTMSAIMPKTLPHPTREQLDLTAILEALSDPIRRAVVGRLAAQNEANCSAFLDCGSKTNMTYHLARLREAGLVRVRIDGTKRQISLRRDDLEARFPGLLAAILNSSRAELQHGASGSGAPLTDSA